jgi:predicted RNA-binding protein with PIN domain
VTFLIDGYNLMHAVGLIRAKAPAGELERARTRLLNWLADSGRPGAFKVVFDAQKSTHRSVEHGHRGVRVLFAFHQTADDVIEELLETEPHPRGMTVVSNDTRVQESARRRSAGVFTCEQFVDWLIEDRAGDSAPPPAVEKPPQNATDEEIADWLNAFSKPAQKFPKRKR